MREPTFAPPAERDLPPGAASQIRAGLVRSVRRPQAGRVRLRLAVAATALTVAVAGLALRPSPDAEPVELLAMGSGELSPTLRRAAKQCLTWNSDLPDVRPSMEGLVMAAERGHHAVVLFLTDTGYVTCDVNRAPGREMSGGLATERWPVRDLMPGPVQRLLLSGGLSSDFPGVPDPDEDVAVSGRVSARVARLVLDHGDGTTTEARLSGGVFGILAGDVDQRTAELVSYDRAGTEIDRQLLFRTATERDTCYVDPSGTVVYGKPGGDCRPAEPWRR